MRPQDTHVVVAGATGYIGKYVVKECVRQGYKTTAVIREGSKPREDFFAGADVCIGDVTDPQSLRDKVFGGRPVNVVISCLASRSGVKQDAYAIDYQATKNCLDVARECGSEHFILLSAYCVRKPLLQFQNAKLKLEQELREAGDIRHSIVRPTAFFKSVSGQFELVQQGWPFVMFGDGNLCRCNPISETDLASFIVNCIVEKNKWNAVLNVGGPDDGLTPTQQAELLFDVLGKEPKFWKVRL
jgi:divinyl chlorophyllide a 8-vinyl-reductase